MGTNKHSVVIIGAREEEAIIRTQIEGLAEILASEPDPTVGLNFVKKKEPTVVLLFLDHDPNAILSVARQIGQGGTCSTIIVSKSRDPDDIILAMRSGARDFAFFDPESRDVRRALEGLAPFQSTNGESTKSKVIAVFSAKGGSGATTIALNLAGALLTYGLESSETNRKVVLLDFDLEMGDVLVFLDVESRYSYLELIKNKHRLDSDLLYRSLTQHASGLSVLSQTDRLEKAEDISAAEVAEVIEFLRHHFDYIVVDGLKDFRDISLVALDSADTIILTMTQDIPALKNADRCLRIFKKLGYPETKTKIVLNRYRDSTQINLDSISDALGKRVDGTVINDFPTVIKAINKGQLLVDSSMGTRVAKDLKALVDLVAEGLSDKKRKRFLLWERR
jgi:pilus assembly protein CpaE